MDSMNSMDLDTATTPTSTTIGTFSTSSSSSSLQPHIQKTRQDTTMGSTTAATTTHAWSIGVVKITDFWREYSVGLGGGPSIKDLNVTRSNWFLPHGKNFRYRRMKIINGLEKNTADNGTTVETCVLMSEQKRVLLKKSL